jgi:hypothetical protein
LIAIFLEKVMKMQPSEIQNYRNIGIRLAQFASEFDKTKKGLSWELFHRLKAAKYGEFRYLIRVASERASVGGWHEPLIPFSQFIDAFERPDIGYGHYYLARDLIVLSMFEHLHSLGYTMSGQIPSDDEDEIKNEYKIDTNEEV